MVRMFNYLCFSDNKKKDGASPLWISDDLEFWPDSLGRFTQIATLHSELIALTSTGQIYQWRWNDPEPYRHPDVSNSVMSDFIIVINIMTVSVFKKY